MTNLQDTSTQKETLKNFLREHVLSVVFTKKDGSERVMECTLKPDLLPPHETNTDNPIDFPATMRAENPDVIQVYDLENNGWRSFRVESVLSFMIRD